MSTALATQSDWTQEQKDLIKKTVAQDASDAELLMFLHIATKAGLDPLQKQIHFTKRQGRVTVIAGIDGLQARASREPDFEGILSGVVCAKDDFEFDAPSGRVLKHVYNPFGDRGPIKGAWATVQRKGKLPFTAMVRFEEFNQPQSPTWKQMPSVMIAKVAKSTALRMSYPEQFSAVYEGAEMDQAGVPATKDVTPALRGGDAVRAALGQLSAVEGKVVPVQPVPVQSAPVSLGGEFAGVGLDELRFKVMEMEKWLESYPKHRDAKRARARLEAMQKELAARPPDTEPGADLEPPPTDAPFGEAP